MLKFLYALTLLLMSFSHISLTFWPCTTSHCYLDVCEVQESTRSLLKPSFEVPKITVSFDKSLEEFTELTESYSTQGYDVLQRKDAD